MVGTIVVVYGGPTKRLIIMFVLVLVSGGRKQRTRGS